MCYCQDKAALHHECTFSQWEGDLLCKVGWMLEDPNCWGILVIWIQEVNKWSVPKHTFKQDDFISPSSWEAAVEAMQQDKPFGGVSMGGSKWTKDVDVDVCFFPSSWTEGDPMLTLVHHASYYHVFDIWCSHRCSIAWTQAEALTLTSSILN